MKLAGKIAIITGGSRGIGYAVTKRFLENGATVVILARNLDSLKKAQSELYQVKLDVHIYSLDVSEATEVDAFFQWFSSSFPGLDILVNCAGIQKPIGKSWEMEADEWFYNIKVNLFGTYLMARGAIPIMIRRNYGRIINFSGGGATSPRPNFSAYASSKTAVIRLTETLAHELKDHNICVNAIAPGAVNTRMLEEIIEVGISAGEKEYEDATKRRNEGGTPPNLAADLAIFLASEGSNGITGRLISAPWDNWSSLPDDKKAIEKSSLYTLRRIDNRFFQEIKND